MKTKSIYISSLQSYGGSLVVSIGIIENLLSHYSKVAFFRPIIKRYKEAQDNNISLMLKHFNIDLEYEQTYGLYLDEVEDLLSQNKLHEVFETIIQKCNTLVESFDFVLVEGLSQDKFTSSLDFDINIEIAKNLQSAYISVIKGDNREQKDIIEDIKIHNNKLKKSHLKNIATFINRVKEDDIPDLQTTFAKEKLTNIITLPEVKDINKPTLNQIKNELGAKVILGSKEQLRRSIGGTKIAAMGIENFIKRVYDDDLIIVSGDRYDIILATLTMLQSSNLPNVAGIILTGGLNISKEFKALLEGITPFALPILAVETDTYKTAINIEKIHPIITHQSQSKIAHIQGLFHQYVPEALFESLTQETPDIMTPTMFEYSLFHKAKREKKTIVLPEAEDTRILKATEILLNRDIVNIVLLGKAEEIQKGATLLGVDISGATIIDPQTSPYTKVFAQAFFDLRKDKCIIKDEAYELMLTNKSYFGTMMVHLGYADGMVSGAINTTADTIRPALQIIKTKPNVSIVSSAFLMCMATNVLVLADCAVVQDPNSEELAQIALSSAQTAQSFEIKPKVAMLSYSTGNSGSGADVDKVVAATTRAKELEPTLLLEGPLQYDAAIDKGVAKKKLPNSQVAGEATVLIFPDLNTGNNTYKAIQRSSGAIAIGPILQGLNKPVNDLSRGCSVDDIINTVAITAIQAQSS